MGRNRTGRDGLELERQLQKKKQKSSNTDKDVGSRQQAVTGICRYLRYVQVQSYRLQVLDISIAI